MKNRHIPSTFLVIPLVLAVILLAGCSPTLARTNPKPPPGFVDTLVPAGDLSAYLYIRQEGSAVRIPATRFGDIQREIRISGTTVAIPGEVEVDRVVASVGPNLDSFAATAVFTDETSARIAQELLSGRAEVTSWRDDNQVNLVRGTGGWATSLEGALRAGGGTPFEEAYPAIWELLHVMPESPPGEPVAAGFVKVDSALLDSLSARAGLDLGGFGQAFGAINVTDIAFIAYADAPLALPTRIGPDYFKQSGLSAIFVVQSTYPGFVLSFFLDSFSDRVGLNKGSIAGGTEVLSREFNDVHLVVKDLGNTLFLSLAPTREEAEALMASTLESHI